jgi:malonate-semialdehyde dehydrogenase (acetylating) / methylmalonate-semialdehyde dehydrogenase
MAILEEPIKEKTKIRNYINGEWVDSKGDMVDVVNPATMKTIARCPISTKGEFDAAVQAAKAAFPEWRRTTPLARSRMLFRLKDLMEEHFEEVSRIQTQEHGKCIDESRGETRRGIENVEVACGVPTLNQGYYSEDIASGIDEWLNPTPIGVFGVIGPFNFPWMIPLWSAPYAIATGNCVVIKPSSEVPISQMKLAELVDEAGFPPGVWNVVNGGRTVVNAMLENKDIAGVTFVGSTATGRDVVYRRCGETGKRVIAQCGAKNFMTIMPDCDVNRTIAAMMTSFFGNTGQRCLAASNAVVVGDDNNFYKSFVEKVVAQAAKIKVGYGLDESIQMGPLRDPQKKANVLKYIEAGLKEGSKMILDGRKPNILGGCPDDAFLGPTIFEDVDPKCTIGAEEIFGPVMSIMRVKTLDEAIRVSNENPYGNGHSIFTQNGKWAREFEYNIDSGNVGINVGITAPIAFFPFSGAKNSFFGILHTQGKEAIRFFTESKVVIQRWF